MKKSRTIKCIKCWCSSLILLLSNFLHAQTPLGIRDSINLRNNISVELTGSMLPAGRVKNLEGVYSLHSKLQSAFSASFYYDIKLNPNLEFCVGIQANVTKWNFF